MAKLQTIYACTKCGAQTPKWSGRCLECSAWGTYVSEVADDKKLNDKTHQVAPAKTIDLNELGNASEKRITTKIEEIDRVLGGGIIPGSLILLSGEPGIGKSTIVAQIAEAIAEQDSPVFYASGEESAVQIKNRLERLGVDLKKIKFLNETNVEKIAATATAMKPRLVIIDSIQTVYFPIIESEAGSVSQIRASAVRLLEMAKTNDIAVILIGHVTKDGIIAGPKALEHIVDAVIYLEADNLNNFRILRSTKNRFGSVNEIGIFEMTGLGFKEIKNPSNIFLDKTHENLSGSVISSVIEGTRPFMVEIQALVTKTVFGYPQRKTSGYDLNRLQVLSTVISKRSKANLMNQDIILNIVGGLKINDPALDLAVCGAIISSLLNQTVNRETILLGEVGLGGEIRNVSRLEQRLQEAEKLGFTRAIIPNTDIKTKTIKTEKIKNLSELIEKFTK